MSSVSVIGAGFSGMSAAACLAKAGYDVTVFEKLDQPGGRARQLKEGGFVFDMGPSWYWMPDVFEKYFQLFNKKPGDFYQLKRLDPSYRIFFSETDIIDVPAGEEALCNLFEQREAGSAAQLKAYLADAAYKYKVGIDKLVYKPGVSVTELFDPDIAKGFFKLDLLTSLSKSIRKRFRDPNLIQLMEFPALFLGATAADTPALYSLMNYADISLGTWYPMGGIYSVVEAMYQTARDQGVKFAFNSEVGALNVRDKRIASMQVNGKSIPSDFVVCSADYHHVEQNLLPADARVYSEKYWNTRAMAPSALIFYVGVNKPLKNLIHHNLFFDKSFEKHADAIYTDPKWPADPLL
ncbi:MAG TPA: phytoene desaturase family protein, partial [Cyclobacteriaceae bacterium]|nr:phytoene desaturase family protein [Cyclobacteriaceae bacterium]